MKMTLGLSTILLLAFGVSQARAVPKPPAEYQRHRENLNAMRRIMAGPQSNDKKLEHLAEAMRQESIADHRRDLLALVSALKGPAQESFLIGVLQSDPDCTVRSAAAAMLGRFGSEAAIAPLAKAAASDAVTFGLSGCMGQHSAACRPAIFALAELGRRLPKSASVIAEEIRKLPEANDTDKRLVNESLGDARRQALFQLTQDHTLLTPYFEQLKSNDATIRRKGVLAFRFLKLTKAPIELVKLARDPSEDVRCWVALVLGEIQDRKTIPLLMALAKDTNLDRGTRCNAIGALGHMQATDAQPLMEDLLSDKDLKVNAAIALSQITGKRHPLVPEGYGGSDWPRNSGTRKGDIDLRIKAIRNYPKTDLSSNAEGDKDVQSPQEDAKQLSSPEKKKRERAIGNLINQYSAMSNKLMTALGNAVAKHKDDDKYCSPLHCAIRAVDAWHVHRSDTDPLLLSIIDYELDAASLPLGIVVSGDYFYPAAGALVRLRVDTKKVLDGIKASENAKQLRLLTWVLLQRAETVNEAKVLLENAKKNSSGNEKENLAKAAKLFDRDPNSLLLPHKTGK